MVYQPYWSIDYWRQPADPSDFSALRSDLLTPDGITDEETLLSRLLALNLDRAAKQGAVQPALLEEEREE